MTPERKREIEKKDSVFWTILERKAAEQGCVFFSDVGNGKEIETDDMIMTDMFGWLIPNELADEFRKIWIADKENDSDDWDDFFVSEKFTLADGELQIEFIKL